MVPLSLIGNSTPNDVIINKARFGLATSRSGFGTFSLSQAPHFRPPIPDPHLKPPSQAPHLKPSISDPPSQAPSPPPQTPCSSSETTISGPDNVRPHAFHARLQYYTYNLRPHTF